MFRFVSTARFLVSCGASAAVTCSAPASTIYVKPNPGGIQDGTSWDRAYAELRTALPLAQPGDQIWVAQGTYLPTSAFDRNSSFVLRAGVALFGGFAGTETELEERDPSVYVTTLSGDLGQNDAAGGLIDNSFHVVRAQNVDATARLDGFVVSRGAGGGNTTLEDRSGRGIFVRSASPVIANCTFLRNFAGAEGSGHGGAVYCDQLAAPLFLNCLFSQNQASGEGGAVYCTNSGPVFRDCAFEGNYTEVDGGAVFCAIGSSPLFESCLFQNNRTHDGSFNGGHAGHGGAFCIVGASVVLRNCTLSQNRTGNGGWGVVFTRGGDGGSGGAICFRSGTLMLAGCLLTQNDTGFGGGSERGAPGTSGDGGAVFSQAATRLVNSTITANHSYNSGAGITLGTGGIADIDNSIFWNNSGSGGTNQIAQLKGFVSGPSHIDRSCVNPGEQNLGGVGNIETNPLFVSATAGNFRLAALSPCSDSGSNAAVPPELLLDLDGNARFIDDPAAPNSGAGTPPIVDMGAFERQIPCTDLNGDGFVDLQDLAELLSNFGTLSGATYDDGDLDGDGDVDLPDLATLLAAFGRTCT